MMPPVIDELRNRSTEQTQRNRLTSPRTAPDTHTSQVQNQTNRARMATTGAAAIFSRSLKIENRAVIFRTSFVVFCIDCLKSLPKRQGCQPIKKQGETMPTHRLSPFSYEIFASCVRIVCTPSQIS